MQAFRPTVSGTIGVFAASSPFPDDRYQRGRKVLEAAGFRVKEARGLTASDGYLAGSDAARARGLLELLEDDEVGALWAVRGGYGLSRILPELDRAAWRAQAKAVLGFSDLTALHALLTRHGLWSIHAPVLTQLGELDPRTATRCFNLLAGLEAETITASGPTLVGGRASGRLVGGNLSVLVSLLGTAYFPRFDDAILVLEDVGEATYRIDRMLTQLILSGNLTALRGIALGQFVGCAPRNEREPEVLAVLEERLAPLGVPTLAGLPVGHGSENEPFVFGRRYTLDAAQRTLRPEADEGPEPAGRT